MARVKPNLRSRPSVGIPGGNFDEFVIRRRGVCRDSSPPYFKFIMQGSGGFASHGALFYGVERPKVDKIWIFSEYPAGEWRAHSFNFASNISEYVATGEPPLSK